MSGVARFESGRGLPGPDGSAPAYQRVAELWFESPEQMQATFSSTEGQATTADIPKFATGGVTMLVVALD
jgi:uncharacterized protein (TIGR02118 family)